VCLDIIPYNIGFVNYRSRHTIIKKNTSIPTCKKQIKISVNTNNNFTCSFEIHYWNEESFGNENLIKKYNLLILLFFQILMVIVIFCWIFILMKMVFLKY
jgi:hypothetical protein